MCHKRPWRYVEPTTEMQAKANRHVVSTTHHRLRLPRAAAAASTGGFFVVTCVVERRELLELLALLALAEPPKSLKPEAPSGLEMEEPSPIPTREAHAGGNEVISKAGLAKERARANRSGTTVSSF